MLKFRGSHFGETPAADAVFAGIARVGGMRAWHPADVREVLGTSTAESEIPRVTEPWKHGSDGRWLLDRVDWHDGEGSEGGSADSFALEDLARGLQTWTDVNQAFGKGVAHGFAIDGFWGTVTGVLDLAEGAGSVISWAWGTAQRTNAFAWQLLSDPRGAAQQVAISGGLTAVNVAITTEQLKQELRQVEAALGQLKTELGGLSAEDWGHIFNGNAQALDGKVSPFTRAVLDAVGDELETLYHLVSGMAPEDAAEQFGRMVGLLTYEAAEVLLLQGLAAATKSAKAARLAKLARQIPDSVGPQVRAALTRIYDKIGEYEFVPPHESGALGTGLGGFGEVLRPSKRIRYLGKTPGKESVTGRMVQDRMRAEGTLRDSPNGMEVLASNGEWVPLSQTDMSHTTDAVTWWNTTGRHFGPKSPEVRQ